MSTTKSSVKSLWGALKRALSGHRASQPKRSNTAAENEMSASAAAPAAEPQAAPAPPASEPVYRNPALHVGLFVVQKTAEGIRILTVQKDGKPTLPVRKLEYNQDPEDAVVDEILKQATLKINKENVQIVTIGSDAQKNETGYVTSHDATLFYALKHTGALSVLADGAAWTDPKSLPDLPIVTKGLQWFTETGDKHGYHVQTA